MSELKANELRIGNLLFEEYGGIYEVEGITGCGNVEMKKGAMTATGFYSISRLTPIPLTEEWLVKFGFVFGIKLHDFAKGKHKFVEFNVLNGNFSESGVFYYSMKTQIKYVHQLQNLYFVLTGEELQQTKKL